MNTKNTSRAKFPSVRWLTGTFFSWLLPGAGILAFVAFTISPLAIDRMSTIFDDTTHVPARVESCELVRDGLRREHAIWCDAQYVYEDKAYRTNVRTWRSQSPFVTLASLHNELAQQSARPTRSVLILKSAPKNAMIPDPRWIAAPALWAYLMSLLIAAFGLAIYYHPDREVYKRDDLRLDPATGELIEINNNHRDSVRRRALTWVGIILAAMFVCLYGLSNRLGNEISMLAFSKLQPVPAQLITCEHRYYGTRKGHDQINCTLQYSVAGQSFTRHAESIDFRSFATDARMDAEVARLQGTEVQAYIDPAYPGYAWGFISTAWFVKYSWGIFELMLLVALVFVLPIALLVFISNAFGRSRPGR